MTTFIIARDGDYCEYTDYAAAETAAKRDVAGGNSKRPRFVAQYVAKVEAPVPEAVVTKLS